MVATAPNRAQRLRRITERCTRPKLELGEVVLVQKVAEGPGTAVWMGRIKDWVIPVAIKVSCHAERNETIAHEGQLLSVLAHPHMVRLLGQGVCSTEDVSRLGDVAEGAPYLILRWQPGGSLDRFSGFMTWPELRLILGQTLDALSYLHQRRLLHLDIKPDNLLVMGTDLEVRPHGIRHITLADFELAKSFRPYASREVEAPRGTPAYMAPEQIKGEVWNYGPWTDLYALGCTVWELATGTVPYGEEFAAAQEGHLKGTWPEFLPCMTVPRRFRTWLGCLLARDIKQRFRRAEEAIEALEDLCRPGMERLGLKTGRNGTVVWKQSPRNNALGVVFDLF